MSRAYKRLPRLRLVVCAVVLLLAWVVPGQTATFRIAVGIDPGTLDPVQMTTTTVGNMVDYVVETLTRLAPDGSIQPHLAESWSVSEDGLHYTFKLRKGVTFHDGVPFDAAAVKWNFERLKDPEVRVPVRAPYPIELAEVVDDHAVAGQPQTPLCAVRQCPVLDHGGDILSGVGG